MQQCFEASQVYIKVKIYPLESAASLNYLGRTIAYNNRYWEALYQNLGKTRRRWGMVSKVLEKMGATAMDREMM